MFKVRILCLLLMIFVSSASAEKTSIALRLNINGAIGPATQDYIHRGLVQTQKKSASMIILQIDTPGGLSESMRGIIEDILASPLPVLCYVAPSGARAASAGTYILYACHINAMAPGTNLGAASPVSLGMRNEAHSTEELKAFHDSQAYIRSLAELRGRNAAWAELSVSKAASLTAQQALQQKVIDIIAVDTQSLLNQSDNRPVNILGQKQIVHTQGVTVQDFPQDWRTQFLSIVTHPSVAYILLIIGIYGIFFELMNPGFILPGIVGLITLLVGLYALQLLPVNYAGLALIIVGIGLIVTEIFFPTVGALGIGGAIAFLIGSILLIKPGAAGFHLPLALIISVTVFTLLFFLGIVGFAIRARRRPVVTGREGMIGQVGEVVAGNGEVWIHVAGERWRALNSEKLVPGQKVKVVGIKGLKLIVELL